MLTRSPKPATEPTSVSSNSYALYRPLLQSGTSRLNDATYLSAISYSHNIQQMVDPTQNFAVKKCMHKRLPITPDLLARLVQSLHFTSNSAFHRILLKAMYLQTFHEFMRVGEMTGGSKPAVLTNSFANFHSSNSVFASLD